MHNADKPNIKDAILHGVYQENLKISCAQVQVERPVKQPEGRIKPRGLSMLLMVLFFVLAQLISDPVYQQLADPDVFAEITPVVDNVKLVSTEPAAEVFQTPPVEEMVPAQKAKHYMVLRSSSSVEPTPVPKVPFNAERLLNYNFFFNADQVRLSSIFGLDVQTIVIDPGHGGKDPGAIGSGGTREKDIVMAIALGLRDQLMESGRYRVLLTRETDTFISLADRVKFSNSNKADLFISLHINALPQKKSNVTETFYFGPPSEQYTLRLAEHENRGSEILSGDFKNMIQKIGDVLKEQESANLAATIQHHLFSNLAKFDSDRDIIDNGTKIAPFVVLLGVDAPSVLVEISCITQKEEEVNLNNPSYREKITSSLKEGIIGYLSNRHTQVVKGDENGKKSDKSS